MAGVPACPMLAAEGELTVPRGFCGPDDLDRAWVGLSTTLRLLHDAQDLAAGESALDQVAATLGMPWACWMPDVAQPYYCGQVDDFVRRRGWPDELLELWWSRHASLKMPFSIRCRFEHLPFISHLDVKARGRPSADHLKLTRLLGAMGITTMLTVPIHLPKGQIGMVTWAGNRAASELEALLRLIAGDLLGICHHFMRIANAHIVNRDEKWRLTPREWDCLRMLAQGYREAEVGEVAGIAKSTVRFHLENVVRKFGVKNRLQAVALAAQLGLLGPIGT